MANDQLTPEYIDQLQAGPELDRLVAESVMGEPQPRLVHDHVHLEPLPSDGGNWVCWPDYEHGDVCEWVPAAFSADMRAAGKVVEQLSKELWTRGFVLEMGNNPLQPKRAWWVNAIAHEQDGLHATQITFAETMPLAICRAALKAVLSIAHRAS